MSIVCGTDFSEGAERALLAASLLAVRSEQKLHLMHCVQFSADVVGAQLKDVHVEWMTDLLRRQADTARACGANVEVHLRYGSPDEALMQLATEVQAELIVIGPLGVRSSGSFNLGAHADRLAQRAHVPVLIVRDAERFRTWLGQAQRSLKVIVGADLSRSTDAALAYLQKWRRIAPCEVTAVHLYWPAREFERLGLDGVRSYLDPDPVVTHTLTAALRERLLPAVAPDSISFQLEPHLGRLGDRLADIAHQRDADLLVVGSRPRSAFGRVWEGSVSHWALHAARTSVLCVPVPVAELGVQVPHMRNVLVATDFSPAGNAAVGLAFALCDPGGIVHLVHVVPKPGTSLEPHDIFAPEHTAKSDPEREALRKKLSALVPSGAGSRSARCHVLEANDSAHAISQAAVRLDADAICVGRRGHSNLAHALLGSTSKELVQHAERPVLIAQAAPG